MTRVAKDTEKDKENGEREEKGRERERERERKLELTKTKRHRTGGPTPGGRGVVSWGNEKGSVWRNEGWKDGGEGR